MPASVIAMQRRKGRLGCHTPVRNVARSKKHSDETQPRTIELEKSPLIAMAGGVADAKFCVTSSGREICAWLVAAAIGVSIYFLPVMRLLDAIAE